MDIHFMLTIHIFCNLELFYTAPQPPTRTHTHRVDIYQNTPVLLNTRVMFISKQIYDISLVNYLGNSPNLLSVN